MKSWFVMIPEGDSLQGFTGFREGDHILIPFLYEREAVEATRLFPNGHAESRPFRYSKGLEEIKT
jgi:hypothetical protein